MRSSSRGQANDLGGDGFPDDFRDFIRALNRHGVEYLLVGGYAVGMYGYVRATTDIDFLYRTTPENIARLVDAMTTFGAPEVVIDQSHLATSDAVTAFGAPPTRIDLLASISGVTFEEAQVDSVLVTLSGDRLPVIGLAALRANKKASGRKKDRDDLKRLPVAASPRTRTVSDAPR